MDRGPVTSSEEVWWGRLSPTAQQRLAADPRRPVPHDLLTEVNHAGRMAIPDGSWDSEPLDGPYFLPDDVQQWIEDHQGK
jgi:hypothetical protein